ncbi:DUF3572 domain-containing protein [uncultured Shimia sp.]|uniref:DUF3572 domain-containing protein n=1 Tax=uncultured Shimia sp. TaxID=573152 RepID=UPI00260AFB23|nr:DUF3572 domain-containing protein [uncultured Shimia sp.]
MAMNQEAAQVLALQALAWLVGNDDLVGVFLGTTGASADDLKAQAGDPSFQVSVLEFLTMDDAWVVAFCDEAGHAYETPLMARHVLAGEAGRHWT